MSKKMLFSIALLLSMPAFGGDVLSFLTGDFKEFVNTTIPAPQRERYADYYAKVTAQIKSKKEAERLELSYTLRQTALDALKNQHRSWASDINAFLNDPHYLDAAFDTERGKLRDFLSWYGAYEKFQEAGTVKEKRAKTEVAKFDSSKMMDSVRTQMAKAKDKISGWFRTLKTKLT